MIAIYERISSTGQDLASQHQELEAWAKNQKEPVTWYRDTFTGKTMERPGMAKLLEDARKGKVSKIVVFRLDRLARNAKGLLTLFEDLKVYGVNFVSLREGIDFSTFTGKLVLTILAGVAEFETEVRAERVKAG